MKPTQIAVIIGWFLLAGFVIWRCFFTSMRSDYDVLFACWLGGVLSLACVLIVRSRFKTT